MLKQKQETKLTEEQSQQLLSGFIQNIDYQVGDYQPKDPVDPQTYIWQHDGIFLIRETPLARFIINVFKAKTPFIGLSNTLKEGCQLKIPRKIPFDIYSNIVQFFRYFFRNVMPTEVYVRIFYRPSEDRFYINVPHQYVNETRASWGVTIDPDKDIPAEDILVCQVHSHHKMTGTFSPIDDRDHMTLESFHLVIGDIFHITPSYELRFAYLDNKVNVEFNDLFENADIEEQDFSAFGDFKNLVRPLKEYEDIVRAARAKTDILKPNKKAFRKKGKSKHNDINLAAAKLSGMSMPGYFGDNDDLFDNEDIDIIYPGYGTERYPSFYSDSHQHERMEDTFARKTTMDKFNIPVARTQFEDEEFII